MSEQRTLSSEPELAKRRFTLGRLVLWTLGGLIVIGIGLFGLDQARSSREMATTLDQLDADDPGWRLEDLEAARVPLADKDNSAILCRELARRLGRSWPDIEFDKHFEQIALPELLDADRLDRLEDEMERLEPIRLAARPLADMPKGRHEIEYAFDPLMTSLDDQQETRRVAHMLRHEMMYLSNKGDVTGAIRSGRACVCAGRSLYDEPELFSQLMRAAMTLIGLKSVEKAISLGEAEGSELLALEELLADEEAHETLLLALRSQRAMMHRLLSRVDSGALSMEGIRKEMQLAEDTTFRRMVVHPRWQMHRQRPILMDLMNRMVENARLPAHAQRAKEEGLDREITRIRSSSPILLLLLPHINVPEAFRRKTAYVAAMRGLIAVERYRMRHGRWPARLADVVPEFLDRLPTDPLDGKPLKMARTSDGVVVYSVGIDGVDDGGKLDRKSPFTPGTDIGFQLWDKAKRRQPASAKPEEEQP